MKPYFKNLWWAKGSLIVLALILLAGEIFRLITSGQGVNSAGVGIVLGGLLYIVVVIGSAAVVKAKDLKVKSPKPVFFFPSQWKLLLLLVVSDGILIGVIWAALGLDASLNNAFNRMVNANGFMSGLVIMPIIMWLASGPLIVYWVVINLTYERLVEYGSAEWRRRQNER